MCQRVTKHRPHNYRNEEARSLGRSVLVHDVRSPPSLLEDLVFSSLIGQLWNAFQGTLVFFVLNVKVNEKDIC
jgi:hypothetical protein